jgi:predicted metallopeptidase
MKSAGQGLSVRRDDPPLGFDFTSHMRRLCDDMVARLEPLRHIDMSRVAVGFSQTRKPGHYGLFAAVTPLRFAGGGQHAVRRGRRWGIQRLFDPDGREMFYVLNFYLPRFLDLSFREKINTIVHELWHIGPKFDGDVRRLGGRCFAHGSSVKRYDAHITALVDRWRSLGPPDAIFDFLRLNFRELTARHGRVVGRRVPTPKLMLVDH